MNKSQQDENLVYHAEGLLSILAEVMREGSEDKSSKAYQSYRKLDSLLRDQLYPLLSKYGLGEGPAVVRFGRKMLGRIETTCRFPELTKMSLVKLIPPFINEAFNGKSLGLIGPIPEIASVRTIIPILALHGPSLKIEYINYADCRREISIENYGNLIRWSTQFKGLKLNRLIKTFVVTSPEVTPWTAVLVVADKHAGNLIPIVDRLSMFVNQTFPVAKIHDEPKLYPKITYLGLREQFDWLNTLSFAGIRRNEKTAHRISKAVKQDRTKLNGGDETESLFGKYQAEANAILRSCDIQIKELNGIMGEIEFHIEDLRHIFKDIYNRGLKRLPTPPQKDAANLVLWSLCRIVETYARLDFDPRDWLAKLEKFGFDTKKNEHIRKALRDGQEIARATYVETDELIREGEWKLQSRTKTSPIAPTDVQLVPYKMAAAFGDLTALSRLAEIFYNAGRYSHGRRLQDENEIAEAKALKFVLGKLIYKNIDTELNRKRINHIRTCLGEFDMVVNDTPYHHSRSNADTTDSYKKSRTIAITEYDENVSYESSSTCTNYSSSCFIVTAAMHNMTVGKIEMAKTFATMIRLRDAMSKKNGLSRILLSTYYKVAPKIIEEIDMRDDRKSFYEIIWKHFIIPCCNNIRKREIVVAEQIYTDMVEMLLFAPSKILQLEKQDQQTLASIK